MLLFLGHVGQILGAGLMTPPIGCVDSTYIETVAGFGVLFVLAEDPQFSYLRGPAMGSVDWLLSNLAHIFFALAMLHTRTWRIKKLPENCD